MSFMIMTCHLSLATKRVVVYQGRELCGTSFPPKMCKSNEADMSSKEANRKVSDNKYQINIR